MHSTFRFPILAVLTFIAVVSLGIRAANNGVGTLEPELAVQSQEIERFGCDVGHPLFPCGFNAHPAGDLFIVEPSFG
jgi:hypothetical protein